MSTQNYITESNTILAPLDRVLPLLQGVKSYSRGYTALCPSHADRDRSLMIWEDETDGHVGLKCFAGCERKYICQSIGLAESDLYLQSEKPYHTGSHKGIDLLDLIEHKLIHPHVLAALGITDNFSYTFKQTDPKKQPYTVQNAIRIPYYTQDGQEYSRFRIRTALTAKNGTIWNNGDDPIIPYGLHKLEEARKAAYVVIVEGESDCWTLWQHGLPVLGIAGASLTNCLQLDYFTGIEQVYIMQEPDKAGEKFPENVYKRLQSLGYKGRVYALALHKATGEKDPNDLHRKDVQGFKASFEKAMLEAKPLHKERAKPAIHRLRDLQQKVLPETKWAIDPILPEGVTILGGKPKLGKSWLALAILNAIASGGSALGCYPVERGEVLYIALEDGEKRLKNRANTVLREALASESFYYATSWPRMDEGGHEMLEEWINEHPQARLICIDTWARFKSKPQGRQHAQYDEDYDALQPLQKLATDKGISIVVVDHMRKMESEDPVDQVSGSVGKTGAVDGFLLLYRKRNETDARLYVIGRDIEEEEELILSFSHECASWTVKGNAEDSSIATTPERQAILDVLCNHPQGLTCKEIAKALAKNVNTTRNLLSVLWHGESKLTYENNRYKLTHIPSNPSKSSNPSIPSNPSKGNENSNGGYYATSQGYYADASTLVTPSNPINPLDKPTQNDKDPQVTTLTRVTRDTPTLPSWLRPGTHDWDKLVERVGHKEAMERRQAALQEIEAVC